MHDLCRTNPATAAGPARRGVTLIELLIVISIMVMLAGIAAPMMRPAMEGRRIREAARGINVFFSAARNHAMEIGRPCGVMIQRFDGVSGCSVALDQVEVPPPYAGDSLDAYATVRVPIDGDGNPLRWDDETLHVIAELTDFTQGMTAEGDLVQLNEQGPLYQIRGFRGPELELSIDDEHYGQILPWPIGSGWSPPVTYKIYRQPIDPGDRPFTKSSTRSLALPAGSVIDLQFSGTDVNTTLLRPGGANDLRPIVILFSPNGSVDRVIIGGITAPLVEPLYLLVGRREKVTATLPEEQNWSDMNNLWITLNPQTGLINTAPMGPVTDATGNFLMEARQFARIGDHMGGG